MSYEGYETYECVNGHQDHYDCYSRPDKAKWRCGECGALLGRHRSVDQTNGPSYFMGWHNWASSGNDSGATIGEVLGTRKDFHFRP